MFVDTHTHLYVKQFNHDRDEVIARARRAGVEAFYLPNIDRESIEAMLALEEAYPGCCFAMMGLHPCSVTADFREELALVREWLERRPFCAIGEIGIDLYWDKTFVAQQQEAFLTQVEWAKERALPVVIHSRDSIDMIMALLREVQDERLRGIFHCFTGTVEQAKAALELGFHLGIGGVVTFKNGGLDKVVDAIPLDQLVLETDSPYLAPVPYRGKRNESAYVVQVAERVAEIKGLPVSEVGRITSRNAYGIFGKSGIFVPG